MGFLSELGGNYGQAIGQIANLGYKVVAQKEATKQAQAQAKAAQAAVQQAKLEADAAAAAALPAPSFFAPVQPSSASPVDTRLLVGGGLLLALALFLRGRR